ncbi:GDSL-type esterase/lipase family protein [Fictibacillus sp. WQ 8-8]|nr:GDSL-type esterase/lipase family protein [Fictibacillus sp. WQ 8-8]
MTNENVRKEIKEAPHVTIDIGANDLFRRLLTDPSRAAEAIPVVSVNLQTILSTIYQLNPDVEVYVMGYYNSFAYYPPDVQAFLLPLLDALNKQIELRSKANGDTYVSTQKNYQTLSKIHAESPR